MKAFFKDIFEYHHFFNQKFISEFEKHQPQLSPETYKLFCHCLNAHQIWNARIINEAELGVHQLHKLKNLAELNAHNHQQTLQIIEKLDLENLIPYQNSKGKSFSNSIKDILFHTANHYTHHKGQIVADFRRNNIEPLVTDYIFYKRND